MNLYENAMNLEEVIKFTNQLPVLPYNQHPLFSKGPKTSEVEKIIPTKVFDHVYWIGSKAVGGILIDTNDGYILIDQGSNEAEAIYMKESIEALGLDPRKIKLLIISHEHFDHYGGTQYFKDHVCQNAYIAMSRVGWNLLQTIPTEFAYFEPRIKKVDIFLQDGLCLQLGNTKLFIVATPGHSPGCVSFIFNAAYKGKEIEVAMMGGSAVWPNLPEARSYQSSIEYFKLYTDIAKCNAYTQVHCPASLIQAIHDSWEGKGENPWITTEENFEEVFFKPFRDRVYKIVINPNTQQYLMPNYQLEGSPIAELLEKNQ